MFNFCRFHQVDWQDVRVGDIMHLSCNDIIPADLLLLRSSDKSGICHVETMNLDGETNLKQRQTITGIRYGVSAFSFTFLEIQLIHGLCQYLYV